MYDKIKNKFMFSLKSKVFSIALLIVGVIFAPQLTQAKTIDLGVVGDTVRIPGTILNSSLSGSGNRCLYVDSSGNLSVKGFDCGSASGGDDMGSHSATQNIRLNTFWLSGDGDNEGIYVTSNGSGWFFCNYSCFFCSCSCFGYFFHFIAIHAFIQASL